MSGFKSRLVRSAFTLVELLLVVTIIGILAAAILPNYVGRTQEARITKCKSDIKGSVGSALDLFESDVGRYPTTQEGLQALYIKPDAVDATIWKGPYLKQQTMPMDPWGHAYNYVFPSTHTTGGEPYDLFSSGPSGVAGGTDNIGNWTTQQ